MSVLFLLCINLFQISCGSVGDDNHRVVLAHVASQSTGAAFPWSIPPRAGRLPYQGFHNDLLALLRTQAKNKRVSFSLFNQASVPLLLNYVLSLLTVAGVTNYFVGALDHTALDTCLALKLPCYNATSWTYREFYPDAEPEAVVQLFKREAVYLDYRYWQIHWIKAFMIEHIVQLNYSVHYSDIDLVYLRPAWPLYDAIIKATNADAIFEQEERIRNQQWQSGVSTAQLLVRPSNTSLRMTWRWANGTDRHYSETFWVNYIKGKVYKHCYNAAQCKAVKKEHDLATVARFPGQNPQTWGACPPQQPPPHPCDALNLYAHPACSVGLASKVEWLRKRGLWAVKDADALARVMQTGVQATWSWVNLSHFTSQGLPCSSAPWNGKLMDKDTLATAGQFAE